MIIFSKNYRSFEDLVKDFIPVNREFFRVNDYDNCFNRLSKYRVDIIKLFLKDYKKYVLDFEKKNNHFYNPVSKEIIRDINKFPVMMVSLYFNNNDPVVSIGIRNDFSELFYFYRFFIDYKLILEVEYSYDDNL